MTCLSCKKDKNEIQAADPVPVIPSDLIGKWGMYDAQVQTRDTIYIYSQNNHYYMTCPDNNASQAQDTIEVLITDPNFTIPSQAVYGSGYFVAGSGYLANNKLYMNYTAGTYTHNGLVYNRCN